MKIFAYESGSILLVSFSIARLAEFVKSFLFHSKKKSRGELLELLTFSSNTKAELEIVSVNVHPHTDTPVKTCILACIHKYAHARAYLCRHV